MLKNYFTNSLYCTFSASLTKIRQFDSPQNMMIFAVAEFIISFYIATVLD
ncbi:hypothetical protein [Treponema pedis]|nr:hypothetical protein [Treponema pedis]